MIASSQVTDYDHLTDCYCFFNRQDSSVTPSKSHLSTLSKVCYCLGLLFVAIGTVLMALCFYPVLSSFLSSVFFGLGIAVFLWGIISIGVAWVLSIKKSCQDFKSLEKNIEQGKRHYSTFFDKEQELRPKKIKFYSDQITKLEKDVSGLDKERLLEEYVSSPEYKDILELRVQEEADRLQTAMNRLSINQKELAEKMDLLFYFYSSKKRKRKKK